MAAFEINIVGWPILKLTTIFHGQFRPDIYIYIDSMFDSFTGLVIYSVTVWKMRKNQFSKNILLAGFETIPGSRCINMLIMHILCI